ncbi:anion transporter|uniref:SLC13 family permease n=1 Tax=Noviherbaspirillum sp. L7-7A TaxID=2850560 RepID=UPI001C2C7823|nr:SLC13 family permease [Noviherbaspirillum sp. L7-7A]MBV0879432.1 anion transporter [Noviherbaspirillum sp. L7-7A]
MADGVPAAPSLSPLQALARGLAGDMLLRILLLALVALTLAAPERLGAYPSLVDWRTVGTLLGLLILTKGIELSGWLPHLARRLVALMSSERLLALFLVLSTAALATVLTNDVALFVVVPLTLTLRDTGVPLTRLIVFEALAANAGSVLTPVGNPQNLFLWQLSHTSFAQFAWTMLPLTLLLLTPLLLLTLLSFSGRALHFPQRRAAAKTDRLQLVLSLALYLPFLVLTDMHRPLAALLVLTPLLIARRGVLMRIDWGLLLVFVLMFIDLRLLGALPTVKSLIGAIDLDIAWHLYATSILASQVISNVPAAILLAQYSPDWKVIAYGVNVGGFGFMMGSLANIIALRMTPDRRAWIVFHAYSLPFLAVAAALAWLVLRQPGA